jgi:hypothetical protein
MKKTFQLFALALIISSTLSITGQNLEKYSQVKIYAVSDFQFRQIENAGLFLDHGINKPGEYFETWLSQTEIKMLQNSGVPFEITVDDWDSYYQERQRKNEISRDTKLITEYNITHNIYGSMGGHMKWQEAVSELDSLRMEYPNFVSEKFSIGNSYENRPMWTIRVTKNPNAPTGRPEIWYNAITHAREPMGMMNVFYYIYWLLENYNIDPVATYILNNREIYFTPFINPDGYVYNQTTNPNGGGMWRKTRSQQSGAIGVDPNRNFGTYNFWNSPNGGSSTSPSSDTYRGISPFSEIETQNFKNFLNSRNFKATLDYHTYGNYLIKPYAWCDPTPTPDDAIFNEFGNDIVANNGYTFGTPYQTVGYYVRGGDLDWIYSNDTTGHSNHIFGMTPEVGTSGFYATQAEIIPYSKNCMFMNIYMAMITGPYVSSAKNTLNKSNYTQGENGTLKVVFKNKGLGDASNIKIEWTSNSNYINIPNQIFLKSSMPSRTSDSTIFNFTILDSCPSVYYVPTTLKIKINDTVTVYTKNIDIFVGGGLVAFSTIGTGTTAVGWPFYSFYHDSRTQMLYTASEIINGGGAQGSIYQLAFNVVSPAAQTLNGFNIKMKQTTLTSLSAWESSGFSTVYSGTYSVPGNGWQNITLQNPFQWDGTSNLLIEICFDNTSYTANTTVNSSSTTGTMVKHNHVDNGAGCTLTGTSTAATRPNIMMSISLLVPVELTSFSSSIINNKVHLTWSTATETNNKGFEIQKSNNAEEWHKLSFVDGKGTSTELSNYSYVDEKSTVGTTYYRLKQIDYDGTVTIFGPIEVNMENQINYVLEQNYPNPFNPTTKINFSIPVSGNISLKVYDILGNEVASLIDGFKEAGNYSVNLNSSNLSSGIYFYELKSNNFTKRLKMMIMK